MIRIMTILALCLLLTSGWAATLQAPETDTWKGTLDAGGAKLRLEIDITSDGEGGFSG